MGAGHCCCGPSGLALGCRRIRSVVDKSMLMPEFGPETQQRESQDQAEHPTLIRGEGENGVSEFA